MFKTPQGKPKLSKPAFAMKPGGFNKGSAGITPDRENEVPVDQSKVE